MRKPLRRELEISRARHRLERDGFPRLQMCLLVMLTGAVGFVASYGLLRAGLEEMWLRYLAAFGIAYLAFLGLLWLWLRSRAEDYADVPDVSGLIPEGGSTASPAFAGRGGTFDGGGASGNFEVAGDALPLRLDGGTVGDAFGAAAEADELAIPLGVILVLGLLLLSSVWIVAGAPLLFAELLVDGVLAASLYKRLRGLETRHWLETAVRRTIVPFALTAVLVAGAGWGMTLIVPEASSMGDVVLHFEGRG